MSAVADNPAAAILAALALPNPAVHGLLNSVYIEVVDSGRTIAKAGHSVFVFVGIATKVYVESTL